MTFEDRLVEKPNRYTLTDDSGNILGTYTLTRAEGTVTREGTPLNAANLNAALQEAVDSAAAQALGPFSVDASNNVRVKNSQSGKVKIKPKAKKVVSKKITFNPAFTSVPSVVVTPVTVTPQNVRASVSNITTTGAVIYLYRTNTIETNICWHAQI